MNVRVIAATNNEIAKEIEAGRFRSDLFYRLNVVQLHVPPLRNRREDILPLARVLLTRAALSSPRTVTGLSPRAADQLLRYDWPGNVRELENAMERGVALGRSGLVEFDELPEEVRRAVPLPSLSGPVRALEEIEKDYILAVLHLNEGNQARTARGTRHRFGHTLPQAQDLQYRQDDGRGRSERRFPVGTGAGKAAAGPNSSLRFARSGPVGTPRPSCGPC